MKSKMSCVYVLMYTHSNMYTLFYPHDEIINA